jgi:gliding motility-associated-like protein
VYIYDRWGETLFVSPDPHFEWNGIFGDKELQPGVYIYHMLIERQIGSRVVTERLKGDVTLVR